MSTASAIAAPKRGRIRLFIDFWNLQLTMNQRHDQEIRKTGAKAGKIFIDWKKLPACLVAESAKSVGFGTGQYSYEGSTIFMSHNPKKAEDKGLLKWATNWLDRQPGVQVKMFERRPKDPPKCPSCHKTIDNCPHEGCGSTLAGTIEKGVDTAIATDMIKLAWEGAYDVAILASSDADLIPAVEFLDAKGIKVVQAGFPPHGRDLATSCWANIDVYSFRAQFEKAAPSAPAN
jgi:uncharacterized LabA/DUF88 family protein